MVKGSSTFSEEINNDDSAIFKACCGQNTTKKKNKERKFQRYLHTDFFPCNRFPDCSCLDTSTQISVINLLPAPAHASFSLLKTVLPYWKPSVCVHLQTERQQRQQGLFGGAGCELRQCLDQFVHHHAKVALQLLPPLLHKLGILQTQRDKQTNRAGREREEWVIVTMVLGKLQQNYKWKGDIFKIYFSLI